MLKLGSKVLCPPRDPVCLQGAILHSQSSRQPPSKPEDPSLEHRLTRISEKGQKTSVLHLPLPTHTPSPASTNKYMEQIGKRCLFLSAGGQLPPSLQGPSSPSSNTAACPERKAPGGRPGLEPEPRQGLAGRPGGLTSQTWASAAPWESPGGRERRPKWLLGAGQAFSVPVDSAQEDPAPALQANLSV